jgi:hypothetical protein
MGALVKAIENTFNTVVGGVENVFKGPGQVLEGVITLDPGKLASGIGTAAKNGTALLGINLMANGLNDLINPKASNHPDQLDDQVLPPTSVGPYFGPRA